MRIAIALAAAACSSVVSAQPQQWMQKPNANELYVTLVVYPGAGCPVSRDQVDAVLSGVLVRSRIKRVDSVGEGPGLSVVVDCEGRIFDIDIDFFSRTAQGLWDRLGMISYGTHGTYGADSEYLLNAVREGFESAITDYLKANFDL